MCDHKQVIVVYDGGGQYKACAECGKQVSEWQQNSGGGRHRYGKERKDEHDTVQSGIIEGDARTTNFTQE